MDALSAQQAHTTLVPQVLLMLLSQLACTANSSSRSSSSSLQCVEPKATSLQGRHKTLHAQLTCFGCAPVAGRPATSVMPSGATYTATVVEACHSCMYPWHQQPLTRGLRTVLSASVSCSGHSDGPGLC